MSTGKPERVRQCHMRVSMRDLSFVQRKAQGFLDPLKERVNWVIDRDRVTRNTARTLFLKGYTGGEAVVRALGHECKLDWRTSGVEPVTSSLSLVDPQQQGSSDESRDVGGGGGLSSSKAVIKAVAKRKAKQDEAPPSSFSERFAARASRACPSLNSKKGV